jgi:site-specific DNA-methyltransferase (adenine-specific)
MSEPVRIGDCELWLGDCREILPKLGKIDALVTDPPYGMAHSGNSSRFSGGNTSRGIGSDHGPIVGDDAPFDPSHLLIGDLQVIWGLNHFSNHLPRGAALVWLKRNDDALGSFLSDAEIAWFSKGCGVYAYREVFAGSRRAIEGSGDPYGQSAHPTQKPVGLMRWCIQKCGAAPTIADLYMGSGTTGVAAVLEGRSFIGCEIEPRHFDTACKRIEAAYKQRPLFAAEPPKPHEQLGLESA